MAVILALFLGGVGAHHYYLDNTKRGILYTVFCITLIPAIFSLVDIVILLSMSSDEFNVTYNKNFIARKSVDYSKMKDLHELKERGIITEDEYLQERKKLIA